MPAVLEDHGIRDVWASNMEEELRNISRVVKSHRYIAMVWVFVFLWYEFVTFHVDYLAGSKIATAVDYGLNNSRHGNGELSQHSRQPHWYSVSLSKNKKIY